LNIEQEITGSVNPVKEKIGTRCQSFFLTLLIESFTDLFPDIFRKIKTVNCLLQEQSCHLLSLLGRKTGIERFLPLGRSDVIP
jgi:hypothetical protein